MPDDRFIACQVVGQDHTAWNCIGEFISQVPNGTIAAIQLSHAELKTLPDPMTGGINKDKLKEILNNLNNTINSL